MKVRKLSISFLSLVLISQFSLSPAIADLDDGYPKDQPAPGRTCPNSELGAETISPFNSKIFVCTDINGVKKWWIKGEPLPVAPTAPTPQAPSGSAPSTVNKDEVKANDNLPPEVTHSYVLPAKSIAKMKIYEDVVYATASKSQHLDIYLPKGVKNPPLMVWTFGGGFIFGSENTLKFDEPAKLLEVFIKNGIAVASVNYRLATEAMYPAGAQDTKMAIRFLRANASKYGYNPKKFATGGDSAGAYLALMAAFTGNQKSLFDNPSDPNLKTSAAVSAVFDLFGNSNFVTMAENKVKYPCKVADPYANMGDPNMHPWFGDISKPEVKAQLDSGNLYPYLKTLKPLPTVYIFHGKADCSVNEHDSMELDKVVKSLKGTSNLYLIPDEIHGGPKIWVQAMKQVPALAKKLSQQ
jgi:acetyl esterase/lipase